MRAAAIPDNEAERLAALRSCGVLDSEPEPTFDEITGLASQLCDVPMALVSLVDANRQWFKSKVGLAVDETPRDLAFCAHAVVSGVTLVVPDALADDRFADNPLVTREPSIRFYAGIPLVLDGGLVAGTLCVLDRVPREISAAQLGALGMLAKQVTNELRLRRRLAAAQARAREGAAAQAEPPEVTTMRARLTIDGVVVGRYRIDRLLGAGGMGVVVAGEDLKAGGRVAIKFLLREELQLPDGRERFVREARALLRVASEHVVRVLDVGNLANGAPFIVMEHLAGEDLRAWLRVCGCCDADTAIDLMAQACDAVASAHACGVVHRDLKPANMFLARREDGSEVLKVLDFGVSKFQGARGELTLTGADTVIGSAYYMAPEQMQGGRDIDGRADLWSLGAILYELLAGQRPFEGATMAELCTAVLLTPHVPLAERRHGLSASLCAVVDRCLSKDRAGRFASARELQAALAACR